MHKKLLYVGVFCINALFALIGAISCAVAEGCSVICDALDEIAKDDYQL
jgi:hypothetical protein